MSEYYIIGENRLVASISSASVVATITHAGTHYVYWRHSTALGADNTSTIRVSTSTDAKIWTTAATVYSQASRDVSPITVLHNGTQFLMLVSETNTTSGTVTTRILTSSNGTSWTSLTTVTWSEFWAHPTDLQWDGTKYYLAATVRPTFDGPLVSTIMTSTNLTAWTSMGLVSQVRAVDNVWPKIAVDGSTIHLVHREGNFTDKNVDDRILYTWHNGEYWMYSRVVEDHGTGNPDIIALTSGYAVIYQDQSIEGGTGIWSWIFYDDAEDTFLKRGTFSQNGEYGMGANAQPTADGFVVAYSTRNTDQASTGKLYFRAFVDTTDAAQPLMNPRFSLQQAPKIDDELDGFLVEFSYGELWLCVSDGRQFYVTPDDFGEKSQQLRRVTATSPFYDGTYLVHSTKENVNESISVAVLGSSQNQVTENIMLLEAVISQPQFRVRVRMGDHQETWLCQSADYSISRGHIMMHNTRAVVRMQIPRLPDVSYEVVQ